MRFAGILVAALVATASLPAAAATITVGDTALVQPVGGIDPGSLSVATPDGWWNTVHTGVLDGSGFGWTYNPVDPVRGFADTFTINNIARDNMTKVITITVVVKADIPKLTPGDKLPTQPGNTNDFWPVSPIASPWPPAWLAGASKIKLAGGNWEAQYQYSIRPQPAGERVSFQSFALDGVINDITGIKIDITCVPEPASWALMIVGFGAVGGALRRRRDIAASA